MGKKFVSVFMFLLFLFFSYIPVYADTSAGIHYLQSQQDSAGKISGFGGESQWAAIVFAENGIDVSTVKKGGQSLKEYLLADIPPAGASATEWERRILAIVAIGDDPTDFGGINYVQNVETLAHNDQLGDTSLVNDDIFGLLSLVAAGSSADNQLKQTALNFILAHQNSDGGFSWSTNPSFNTSDSNDTAAALQALLAVKNSQLNMAGVDSAIQKAKNYLLSLQAANGGFKYDTSPWSTDPDSASTAWALMALNKLDLAGSSEAVNAKNWLNAQQEPDGGFHWMSGSGSDTATTSYALIALSGSGLLFSPQTSADTPAPSIIPALSSAPTNIPSATSTPTPALSTSCADAKPPTPLITNATIVNSTTITLSWNKITEPMSYYLLAYGTTAESYEYGNPNIGGKDLTSYTVSSLKPGATYYFKIRAGNGCRPGDFSNVALVKLAPQKKAALIVSPTVTPRPTATTFLTPAPTDKQEKAEVLGVQTGEENSSPIPFYIAIVVTALLCGVSYWYFKLKK